MANIDSIARQRFVDAGLVFTGGRRLVLETLARLDGPAPIPVILDTEPKLIQSSLYRNLAVLEEVGLITRLDVGDQRAYYELSETLTDHHHHHLVCRSCQTVVDVTLPARAERTLDKVCDEAAASSGFAVEEHRLDLVGLCPDCAAG